MRNSFLKDFYKVNPSLNPANKPEEKPADNNDDNSMRESMEDIKACLDALKQEQAELSKYINQQPTDNGDNSSNVDNNEGGADNAS